MEASELVEFLSLRNYVPNEEQHRQMVELSTLIATEFDSLDEVAKKVVLDTVKRAQKQRDPRMGIIAASLGYAVTGKSAYIKTALNRMSAFKGSAAQLVANLNGLSRLRFTTSVGSSPEFDRLYSRTLILRLYGALLKQVKTVIKEHSVAIKDHFKPNNRVVIMTQQFVGRGHAPTIDCVEFARILIKEYGKDVLIVNTMELGPEYEGSFVPMAQFTTTPQQPKLLWEGVEVDFWSNTADAFNDEGIIASTRKIEEFDPAAVIVVGGRCVLAELFTKRAFVFMYPTSREIPITTSAYFHTWDEPDDTQRALMKNEGLDRLHLFSRHPGFKPPEKTSTLTRAELNIPEDDTVYVIAGMRLDSDVDGRFIAMLEKVATHEKAHFAFVGIYEKYDTTIANNPILGPKSNFVGFQEDVMAFYEICDIYLNPARHGAGSIIIFAQAAGLPTLSLRVGDSGAAAEGLPEIADYDHMAEIAIRLADDAGEYAKWQDMGYRSAQRLTSRGPLVEDIITAYEKFSVGELSSN